MLEVIDKSQADIDAAIDAIRANISIGTIAHKLLFFSVLIKSFLKK